MKLLGHRGYSGKYPENTMIAFQKAYEKGFDGIETDVHMSQDGELVLIHDEKINRTSNGKGYVNTYTLKELKTFNFSYHHEGFYEIPTLKELLSWIKGKDFLLNIELKTDVIHYPHIEEKVVQLVKEMNVQDQVIYSSFYLESLLKVRTLDPEAYVGYLIEYHYKRRRQRIKDHHILAIHPHYHYLTQKTVSELKQNNIYIVSWTIPNLKEYQRLKDLGVDILISNEYFK